MNPAEIAIPMKPLMPVSNSPSQKNCARMLRLVAPIAFSRPISRVRSRHRDQHDVDDAHRAQSQRHNAHAAQKDIHRVEDGADHLLFLNGVELLEGVFERGIEAVPRRDHVMHRGNRGR